tara:strand:- start:179 stop:433 length:255 start_codon:yes stop_codon:yes gene_type:complete
MPNYDYKCKLCDFTFEKQLLIADRNKPTKQPCPKCGEKAIKILFGMPGIGDSVSLGQKKIDNGMREVFSKIEEKTGQKIPRKFD